MKKRWIIFLSVLLCGLAYIAYAHTNTTTISRSQLAHPDLGYEGGASLHTAMNTLYKKLGDNENARFFYNSSIIDSATITMKHNLGVAFDELRIYLYTGAQADLTRVTDPVAAGWSIVVNTGEPKLSIDVTTPSSGQPHNFAVVVIQGNVKATDLGVGTTDATEFASSKLTGAAGAGFLELSSQSAEPSAPAGANDLKVFADSKKLYTKDANGIVQEVGAGAGSGIGQPSYIANHSASSDVSGWVESANGALDVSRTIDTGELPRANITGTGLKFVGTAAATGAYVAYDFNLDEVDKDKYLKIEWEQRPLSGYATGDFEVFVQDLDGGVPIVPTTTAIPNNVGMFQTTFKTKATTNYELRIKSTVATSAGLVISNVIVGASNINVGFYSKSPQQAGFLQPFAGGTVPDGWLACDGSAVSRGTYEQLFARIGTLWGVGDGSTTFNVPDLQTDNRFLRSDGGSLSVGDTQTDMLASHTHTFSFSDFGSDSWSGTASSMFFGTSDATTGNPRPVVRVTDIKSINEGRKSVLDSDDGLNPELGISAAGGTETRPNAAVVKYIIKAFDDVSAYTLDTTIVSPDKAGFVVVTAENVASWPTVNGLKQKGGWALADGSEFAKADYPDIYNNLGGASNSWNTGAKQDGTGGNYTAPTNTATHGRLPDLRAVFLRGVGTSSKANGTSDVSISYTQFLNDTFEVHKHNALYTGATLTGSGFAVVNSTGAGVSTTAVTSSGSTETAPRSVGVYYIIKLHDDKLNASVLITEASETETGVIALNSDFAATETRHGLVPKYSSGTFTPTLTSTSGLDSNPTNIRARYLQVGNIVTVSGELVIDPTGATDATWTSSLPVTTANFPSQDYGTGTATMMKGTTNTSFPLAITAVSGAQIVSFVMQNNGNSATHNVYYQYQYEIQ